uniref:Uncharacterized protein n=1 Tax=Chrysemys picta bellii TaxID=8478 RepID=A0A8C3F7U0_CHRPI
MCLCVSFSGCVHLSVYANPSTSVCVCVSVRTCMCVCRHPSSPFVSVCISLCVPLSFCAYILLPSSVCPCACVCLSLCVCVCVSFCACVSVCVSPSCSHSLSNPTLGTVSMKRAAVLRECNRLRRPERRAQPHWNSLASGKKRLTSAYRLGAPVMSPVPGFFGLSPLFIECVCVWGWPGGGNCAKG